MFCTPARVIRDVEAQQSIVPTVRRLSVAEKSF